MDRIIIRDLLVKGILGIYEHERHQPQDILINLTLYTDIRAAGQSDDIADCIDYEKLAQQVQAKTINARRFTVEALATDIARLCLDTPGVQGVRVRVEKPGALQFTRAVGVEIERFHDVPSPNAESDAF